MAGKTCAALGEPTHNNKISSLKGPGMPEFAPLSVNQLPYDPALDLITDGIDSLSKLHGYAVVSVVYKPDGKMGVHASGLDTFGGDPGKQFQRDPSGFFHTLGSVLAVVEELQRRENEAAGRA